MNQFLERLLHISVYPSPPEALRLWILRWCKVMGRVSGVSSVSLLHFLPVKLYWRWDEGGEEEEEDVSQEPGAVSDFCSPAVWPKGNYLSLEPSSRLWNGDNDGSCCVSGLWPWLPEEMYVGKMRDKRRYTLVGAEIGSCTCVTCVILKKIFFKACFYL